MEDPVKEAPHIIHLLTQSYPTKQRETIEKYFLPNASFTHPFCRTGSFPGSRLLIRAIYRWYKMMSPRIDIKVNSIAFDEANLILYCHISQIFRIWLFPWYAAPVSLVTVLRLEQRSPADDGRYYIRSQNDLYQVNEWLRFIVPAGFLLAWLWQVVCTGLCVLGAVALWPITWAEENVRALRDAPGYGRVEDGRGIKEDGILVPMGLVKNNVIRM